MSTSLTSTGSIFVKNVGRDLQGESLDAGASLSVKRKVNGITYSARITEATIKSLGGAFKGAWLQLSKPLGPNVTGNLMYDVGLKAFTAQVNNTHKFSNGRSLDLGAVFRERNNELALSATAKPHKQHKFSAVHVPSKKSLVGSYALEAGNWIVAPTYDFNKKTTVLSVNKKLKGSTIGANYNFKDKAASVSWNRKPFTVAAKIKVGREGFIGKPTIGLTVNRDFVIEDAPFKQAAQDAKAQAQATGKQAAESGKKVVTQVKDNAKAAKENLVAALKYDPPPEKAKGKKPSPAPAKGKKAAPAPVPVQLKNPVQEKVDELVKAVKEFCDNVSAQIQKATKGPEPAEMAKGGKRK